LIQLLLKAWIGRMGMGRMVYGLWLISLTWPWHVTCMRWLVIKVAWCRYELHFYIHELGRMIWNGFNMEHVWGWIIKVGMRFISMINITVCLNMYSMWSVGNSLESLGEISRSCFSGRDVIPWPLLMGVHDGAPSI